MCLFCLAKKGLRFPPPPPSLAHRRKKTPASTTTPKTKKTVEPLFQALCDNSALNPDTDAEEQADAPMIFDRLEAMAGAMATAAAAPGDDDGGAEEEAEERGR